MKKLPVLLALVLQLAICNHPARLSAEEAASRSLGINFFAVQVDYCEDRFFADVMKTARLWVTPGNYGNGTPVNVDEDGWPLEDAEVCVWHGPDRMNGTYRLEGCSKQRPSISLGYGGGQVANFAYLDGKFSADIIYGSTGRNGLLIGFTGTGGGVRDVKLMRPVAVGSTASYPTTAVFTDNARKLVEKFSVVRFMWPIDAWNGPWQVSWADRVSPTCSSFQRGNDTPDIGWAGKGMAWEYAIRFCNETGKDMWLNMPIAASDDYVARLARLVKDEYKVPGGKVYWEYSNEATWDASQMCSSYLRTRGLAEANGGGPVGYDGERDPNVIAARYYAKRAAEMSLVWRGVWGDEAMMTRIRPIASGQLTYDAELVWGLDFVHNWYNNGDGGHVAAPHPVGYFFYGCGGSHYTKDNPDQVTDGVSEIAAFEAFEEEEACLAKMYGLRRTAYEGGVWTSKADYRLPRIREAMIRYQSLWDAYDGDLLVYYVTTGGEEDGTALGFTMDSYNLDTPKFGALDYLVKTPRGEVTKGKLAPCDIAGADFSASSVPWEHPAPGARESAGGGQLDQWRTYKGYLVRVAEAGKYGIILEYDRSPGALVEIMVDGVVIMKEKISGNVSRRCEVSLLPGLHGIRIRKLDPGYFTLNKVRIVR